VAFIDSKLTQLVILASLLLGVFAVLATPREEEPQIVVPFADIFVEMPGASVKEVEERISIPMEKKVWEIRRGVRVLDQPARASVVIVRFYVGQDEEAEHGQAP
jgi:multidrug efflux pump subunit AcrB